MGKKGKKGQAGKPKKLTPKDVGKRLNVLAKNLEEELKGADLFTPLPPTEDCAICLVPLSHVKTQTYYQPCCGNDICYACHKENEESINKQNEEKNAGKKVAFTCPFCREPEPTSGLEYLRRLQARSLNNDYVAFELLGNVYRLGEHETPKDDLKALDCYLRAVELGSNGACGCIGTSYREGVGVSVDKEKSALFDRAGALRGDPHARHNIGCTEYNSGNHEVGIRHWKIAAEAGYQRSLDELRRIYNANGNGKMLGKGVIVLSPGKEFISKEEMDTVYRSGHEAQMEVKSEEREKRCGTNPLMI
jgi:TPR repeat protein